MMEFVDQKIVDPAEKGDCLTACIASVLGIPYDVRMEVLRGFFSSSGSSGRWLMLLQAFAIGIGYRVHFETFDDRVPPDVVTIAGGPSPRGCKCGHAVVMRGCGPEVIHDPHPSRAGLAGPAEDWLWFEPLGD